MDFNTLFSLMNADQLYILKVAQKIQEDLKDPRCTIKGWGKENG